MHDEAVKQALAVMDRHIEALNARDNDKLIATLHFPHYRLSGSDLKIWETPERYQSDFLKRAGADWSHSAFEDIEVTGTSENKVHLNAEIQRFRKDGSLLTRFRSLWVITCEHDVWAAKLRSTFAPL